jgi:hypothetical protein
VVVEDLRFADFKENPASSAVHEPHTMVLITKWVLLMRHLYNAIRRESGVGRCAQRMPGPGKIL